MTGERGSEPFWLRHDLHIAGIAVVILAMAWLLRAETRAPPSKRVTSGKLSVAVPAEWLAAPPDGDVTTVRGDDAVTRLELRSGERPAGEVSLDGALELDRGRRYGELYQRSVSERANIGGRDLLRTVFAYAFKPTPTHAPRVAAAVEYAFPIDGQGPLHVVTLHASEARLPELEARVMGTIEVAP